MRRIKYILIAPFTIFIMLILSLTKFSVNAGSSISVALYEQESLTNSLVRYIAVINNVTNEDDLVDYNVVTTLIDEDGTKHEATRTISTFYRAVSDIASLQAADYVYYGVFTITNLDSYVGKRIETHFVINFSDNTSLTTNSKYYECGKKTGITVNSYAGYDEGAYVNFNGIDGEDSYQIQYRSETSNVFTTCDEELTRNVSGNNYRADALGLTEGNYYLRITNGTYISDELLVSVSAYDRSGYAHFDRDSSKAAYTGVGAYKDDGTLKDDTEVVYVTEDNKNTVSATINNKTVTGLGNILAEQTNASLPLNIRIVGTVGAATWNYLDEASYSTATTSTIIGVNGEYLKLQNYDETALIDGGFNTLDESQYSKLDGLTNKIKYDSSKNEFDSYYNMMDVSSAKNITVEGVGEDAQIFQWGFTWKSCQSIEVRNLLFDDYTEDACSFEGASNKVEKTTTSYDITGLTEGNLWLHNCTFNMGMNYWDVCSEQDKGDGDGATDFKYTRDITISYCHYVGTHKTGLVGGSENQITANITFHHNWYEGCKSRLPYARQANMHMYNNYYDNSTGTTMQIYAGAYAFIENCYFENDNKTFDIQAKSYQTAAVKSYGNTYDGSKTYTGATIVSSRTETVSNGNIFIKTINDVDHSYQTFDTDSSIFYYDSTNKVSDVEHLTTASVAKEECQLYAGTLNSNHYNLTEELTYYTVSFDTNGGNTISSVSVEAGKSTTLPTPTKSGYTFLGWYTSNNVLFTDSSIVTSNITLYASWEENQSGGEEETQQVLNFSIDAVTGNDFFSVQKTDGSDVSLKSGIASKTYDGTTYTKALKVESKTTITFTSTATATLKIITDSTSVSIKVDGTAYTPDTDGVITLELSAGDHTIGRNSSEAHIYAVILG